MGELVVAYSPVEPASNELEQNEEAGAPCEVPATGVLEAASEAVGSLGIAESRHQPAAR